MNSSAVSGQGPIDYVIVIGMFIYACYALSSNPKQLLVLLPTIVSVYFFIPLGSMLTPERTVPLVIAVWLLVRGKWIVAKDAGNLPLIGLAVIWLSTIFALTMGDAGTRPLFRALYYTGLVSVFLFVLDQTRSRNDFRRLMLGFANAGLIHGGYSFYQLVAFRFHLPFRAIARESGAKIALVTDSFRINGLASEPKRLGFILFAGAIGALATSLKVAPAQRLYWVFAALAMLFISTLTFSTSYYAALAITVPILLVFFPRFIKYVIPLFALISFIALIIPTLREPVVFNATKLIEERQREFEVGLDGKVVYRQEFFAQDLLIKEPWLAISGVGMGRYNITFNNRYGYGAGYFDDNVLAPLNSQFLEAVFDLGILGPSIIYMGLLTLLYRLGGKLNSTSYALIGLILFLAVQSFFVQSFSLLIIATAGGLAYLRMLRVAETKRVRKRELDRAAAKSKRIAQLTAELL